MKTLAWIPLLAWIALGCSGEPLKNAGEECFGATECAEGLVCNYSYTPSMCTLPSDRPPDAAVPQPDAAPAPDGGTPDAAPVDAPPVDAPVDAPPPDAPVDAPVADAPVADAV